MNRVTDAKDLEAIKASGLFDELWYLERHPDVARLGIGAIEHYLWLGWRLGRDPSRHFRTNDYLAARPDVAAARMNPLLHFIKHGNSHDRSTLPPVKMFRDTEPDVCAYYTPAQPKNPFDSWRRLNKQSRYRTSQIRQALIEIGEKTKFSIVVPVYNPPLDVMRECIESVMHQTYRNFELILVDDKSPDATVVPFLKNYARLNRNVTVVERVENGHISAATNDGVAAATGDYIVLLDNDDVLDTDALAIIAERIAREPDVDFLYSDDAKFKDDQEELFGPKFKPGWSPELLLSYCYVSHIKVFKTELYRSVGGCRSVVDGSQDHDLVLRAVEKTDKIVHLPHVLYRRRVLPGSTAASGHAKPYTFEAGRRACEEAFARRGVNCSVRQPAWAFERGLGVFVPKMPDQGPEVSLIIPTRNNWRVLDRLLKSISKTEYKNYRVLIVDNFSDDPETVTYLKNCKFRVERVQNRGEKFNFSHINNTAVRSVSTEFVLFLNDDTEILEADWLSQMMGWAQLEGVGAVGARLLYENRRLQHGGIVPSLPWRVGRTAFRGLPERDLGYLLLPRVTRNCSAVTAACMLTRRSDFLELGGFDEEAFGVAYNDIDYCMRLRDIGKRVVYCGEAELLHHEGTSRGKTDAYREIIDYEAKWGRQADPYFNPNLSTDTNRHELKGIVVPPVKVRGGLKVLAITHNLRTEGAPNSAFEIIAGLNEDGRFDVSVASPTDGPLGGLYRSKGIPVDILEPGYSINRNLKDYHGFLERLSARLRMQQFDVVYANTADLFWVIEAAALAGVPSIWNIRESESWKTYYDRYGPDVGRRALQAFGLPYRTIFVANSTRKRWAPVDTEGNFHVITNGVDPARFKKRSDPDFRKESRDKLGVAVDDVVMICMGTVSARKCQHELIEGFAKLPSHLAAKAKLVIVGARPSEYLEYVNALVASKRHLKPDAIQIIPETRATGPYWASADMFVFASRMESYPRVILEAMGHGLPIVTTPTYGIVEQVKESVNALFYRPGKVEDLTTHMARLVENEDLRREMGAASLKVLEGLTPYSHMVELYKEQFIAAAFSAPAPLVVN